MAMLEPYAVFFYSEQKLRDGMFRLEVRLNTEMLPRSSVVVGMLQGTALVLQMPAWLNPDYRPHVVQVVRDVMRQLGVSDEFEIVEIRDTHNQPTGQLSIVPPAPSVDCDTIPYLVWTEGGWAFQVGEPPFPDKSE